MKTRILSKFVAASIALSLAAQPGLAAVPQRILYQGTLRQTGGLYTGNAAFVFRITDSSGGTEYWNSGSTVVAVTAGLFRYPLGVDNPGTGPDESATFLTIDWSNISPYIEVTVNGSLLSPREEIQSVPYAIFNSAATDMVNPRVLRAGDSMTGQLTIADSTLTVTGNAFSVGVSTLVVKDGMVGIGLSNPASRLHVLDGDIRVSTSIGQPSKGIIFQDDTSLTTAGGANSWAPVAGSSIANVNAGNVGIGTNDPDVKLHVSGNMHIDTSGTSSLTRNVTLKSGGSMIDWASYGGGWAPGLMLQGATPAGGDSASEFLFMSALDDTQPSLIASGKDLEIYTGAPIGSSGSRSLYLGGANLFLGVDSGRAASGANNAFLGYQTGYSATNSGNNNSLFGYQAGFTNTSGGNNASFGYQAGYSNATGSGNLFLGYQAGYFETGSNKLYIDNSNTATEEVEILRPPQPRPGRRNQPHPGLGAQPVLPGAL